MLSMVLKYRLAAAAPVLMSMRHRSAPIMLMVWIGLRNRLLIKQTLAYGILSLYID